jgi:hypothetical protein
MPDVRLRITYNGAGETVVDVLPPEPACAFCGAKESAVSRMAGNGTANICGGCVAECVALLLGAKS